MKIKYYPLLYYRFEKPNQSTWTEVNNKLNQVCPNFMALVDLVLTIPASSADAECGFNRLKITKSDWRSKLSDRHLSDQLTIMLESSEVVMYDPLAAIHLWNETPRRIHVKKEIATPVPEAQASLTETPPGVVNLIPHDSELPSQSDSIQMSQDTETPLLQTSLDEPDLPSQIVDNNVGTSSQYDDQQESDNEFQEDSDYESDDCYSDEEEYVPLKERKGEEFKALSHLNEMLSEFTRYS